MSMRKVLPLASLSPVLVLLSWALSAVGQQGGTSPAAAPATAKAGATAADATTRDEILDSPCWRRAMFELDQWYRSQTIYTPEEVAAQKAHFADRVEKMSLEELRQVIADLQVKFQILSAPELQETRAWFGQYLSVLADRKRDEVLRDIPNFATMTPAQLTQEIMKIQRKKQQGRAQHAAFDQLRQQRVNSQLQANREALAAQQKRAAQRTAYRAPYRPPTPVNPFENEPTNRRRMSRSILPTGEIITNISF